MAVGGTTGGTGFGRTDGVVVVVVVVTVVVVAVELTVDLGFVESLVVLDLSLSLSCLWTVERRLVYL